MAELTIRWETLTNIPPLEKPEAVVTGEDAAPAAEPVPATTKTTALMADKPYVIYVADPAGATSFDTVEKVILDDDRVKLGTRAFHAVKMSPEDAKADPLLTKDGGKEVPRIIFVTADLKTVKPLEGGQLKLGEVWSAMKVTANRFYKQDLDTTVRELKSVLVEFDKIANERKVLEEKEKRSSDLKGMTAADKKDIEAKRTELDKREAKAQATRDKLWELRPKNEAKGEAKPA